MHKVLFEIPALGLRAPSLSVTMLAACLAALGLATWRARRERIDPEAVAGLAVWLMGGGFVGARLLYLLTHPEAVRSAADVVKVWQGGIVFYGCIIGGLIGSVTYWVRRPFPFRAMADAVAPALVIGSGIGRVGCFLNGCCYGAPTFGALGVAFPADTLPWARHVQDGLIPITAGASLPVHPTQLYSALDAFLVLGLLTWYFPRRRRDGEVMALLMVTYPVARFCNEVLRGDEPALVVGLSLSQVISLVVLAAGILFWAFLATLPKARHADARPRADRRPDADKETRVDTCPSLPERPALVR